MTLNHHARTHDCQHKRVQRARLRKRLLCGLALTIYLSLFVLVLSPVARGHWRPGTVHNRVHAINHAFCAGNVNGCSRGNQALRVAYCESGPNLWPYASNGGKYLGMFQVSDHWRRVVPGWSWFPWQQARHAYRVYRLTGSSWSHWECSP